MVHIEHDTPTNLVAEYGMAGRGEEDSVILTVRINDRPVDIVLVFALVTDAQELHSQLGRIIAGWAKD